MDKFEAARALGLADADVLAVENHEHGTVVTVKDGGRRLLHDDGSVFAVDEHPATQQLRRWDAPEPDLVDIDGDGVPDGNADGVLAWVGDDPDRATRAIEAETERDSPRSVLISKLRKVGT